MHRLDRDRALGSQDDLFQLIGIWATLTQRPTAHADMASVAKHLRKRPPANAFSFFERLKIHNGDHVPYCGTFVKPMFWIFWLDAVRGLRTMAA